MKAFHCRGQALAAAVALSAALTVAPAQRCAAAPDLSPEEVQRLVSSAPGAAEYPEAGAIVLYDHKRLTVKPDGSQSLDEHILVKILKDRARGFGDQKRLYDEKTDSLSILTARTWLPDGSSVPVEDKAINVITPPELVGAAIYADIKQKVVSFPSIGPDVVVELHVRTDSRPDTLVAGVCPYGDLEVFRGEEPVLDKSYELALPESFPEPLVRTDNGLAPGEVSREGGARLYRWQAENVPMITRIPDMPPVLAYAPSLIFSNVESWESLGRWLAAQFYPAAAPDEPIRAKAAELTRGCATPADSIRAISLFVQKNVRNIPLSLGLAGWKPHAASKVLENMYGEQLDKTVLLSSLLTAAGFENWPALTGGDQIDVSSAQVPSTQQFSRLAVYVQRTVEDSVFCNPLYSEAERRGMWLVPMARYNRYGYFNSGQDARAVVVLPSGGTLFRTTAFPPEKSLALNTASLKLDSQGNVSGRFETLCDGLFDAQARAALMDLTPVDLEKNFQQAANSINEGASLEAWRLSDLKDLCLPAGASLDFNAPELGVLQGDMLILRLPRSPFDFAGLPYFPQLREREYDFVASGPFVLSSEVTLELPAGWRVAYSPQTDLSQSRFGNAVTGCRVEAGKLVLTRRLTVTARRVSVADYADFRSFLEQYSLPEKSLLLFERSAGKKAPKR